MMWCRENPAANGGRPQDRANFVTLLRELRAAFNDEAKVGMQNSEVSILSTLQPAK